MPFGLCNTPTTFQRCMVSIFSKYVENKIKVFMDDFTVYGNSFQECLTNLTKILKRSIETNLVLDFEKCHFMVSQSFILGHIVSKKGIKIDNAKIDVTQSLPYPTCVREVCSFLAHVGFYRMFIKDFSKIIRPMCQLLQKEVSSSSLRREKKLSTSSRNCLHLSPSYKHQIGISPSRSCVM